jgi:glycosyltransferase involved in cell wall biosynthesis
LGYPDKKGIVIENGVVLESYRDIRDNRSAMREHLGITKDSHVILCMARYAAQKDVPNLLDAIRILEETANLIFLFVGDGMENDNKDLIRDFETCDVSIPDSRIKLLGLQSDPASILATADLLVLPSQFGEALPLVILESLAAGISCVATDIGGLRDIARLIKDESFLSLVPPQDARKLANTIVKIISQEEKRTSSATIAVQNKIQSNYGVERMTNEYAILYKTHDEKTK